MERDRLFVAASWQNPALQSPVTQSATGDTLAGGGTSCDALSDRPLHPALLRNHQGRSTGRASCCCGKTNIAYITARSSYRIKSSVACKRILPAGSHSRKVVGLWGFIPHLLHGTPPVKSYRCEGLTMYDTIITYFNRNVKCYARF